MTLGSQFNEYYMPLSEVRYRNKQMADAQAKDKRMSEYTEVLRNKLQKAREAKAAEENEGTL